MSEYDVVGAIIAYEQGRSDGSTVIVDNGMDASGSLRTDRVPWPKPDGSHCRRDPETIVPKGAEGTMRPRTIKITAEFETSFFRQDNLDYYQKMVKNTVEQLATITGPKVNLEVIEQPITVGMGATKIVGSDRYPFTVIEVVNDRRLVLQSDEYRRTDKNGLSELQEHEYTPNPDGSTVIVTKRKDGRWVQQGESIKGTPYHIGERRAYQDPSF